MGSISKEEYRGYLRSLDYLQLKHELTEDDRFKGLADPVAKASIERASRGILLECLDKMHQDPSSDEAIYDYARIINEDPHAHMIFSLGTLEDLSVSDLRSIARKRYCGPDKSVIASMNKEDLIEFVKILQEQMMRSTTTALEQKAQELFEKHGGIYSSTDPDAVWNSDQFEQAEGDEDPDLPAIPSEPQEGANDGEPDSIESPEVEYGEQLSFEDMLRDTDLEDIIVEKLRDKFNSFDEDRVREIATEIAKHYDDEVLSILDGTIEDKIKDIKPGKTEIVVKVPDMPDVDVGIQHEKFEDILKLAAARLDMFLVGPAGSGKTTACHEVANALGIEFYFQPVGLQTTKSDLLGYRDVNGNYQESLLRRAYEHGGVFLLDEIDAGNPNVLTVINAMLSNHIASFPDGMIKRHEDFIFIAAGNTYGHGGDVQYVGRNQIDAATLDRFVMVDFGYDEALEGTFTNNDKWLKAVRARRWAASELREHLIVSPRAVIKGTQMLEMGFSEKDCLEMLVYRGISRDVKDRVEGKVKEAA